MIYIITVQGRVEKEAQEAGHEAKGWCGYTTIEIEAESLTEALSIASKFGVAYKSFAVIPGEKGPRDNSERP